VDQKAGGDIVVQLTSQDAATVAAIAAKAPEGNRSIRVEPAHYSRRELEAAVEDTAHTWRSRHGDLPFVGVALDTVANRLRVEIEPGAARDLDQLAADLTKETGVEVAVVEVTPG
jgi:hypothetical protein